VAEKDGTREVNPMMVAHGRMQKKPETEGTNPKKNFVTLKTLGSVGGPPRKRPDISGDKGPTT